MLVSELAEQLAALAAVDPSMPVEGLVHHVSDHGGVRVDQWLRQDVAKVVTHAGFCYVVCEGDSESWATATSDLVRLAED